MTTRRDIELNVIARVEKYQRNMAKIPGMTDEAAAKAAVRFERRITTGMERARRNAEKAARESAEAWGDVGTVIQGALGAEAIKAATAGVFDFVTEIQAGRTEVINLSAAMAIGTDTLTGLQVAARRGGEDFGFILGSIEDFGEVLFDFTQGGGRAKEALELLGFTTEEVAGRMDDTDGVFRDVVGRMVEMEEGATKNAVAQQLFSDAGNRLNAILGDGTLEDYIALAEQYGITIDEDAIDATKRWNAAVSDLEGVLKGSAIALIDLFDLTPRIADFTLGFVAMGAKASATMDFLRERIDFVGLSLEAIANRDLEGFIATQKEAADTSKASWDAISERTEEAARAFFDARSALDDVGDSADSTARALGALSEAEDRAAKDAAKAAAEAARQARLRDRMIAEQTKAIESLNEVFLEASSDQLTEQGKINRALEDELAKIREIEGVLGQSAATQAARDEVRQRALRDGAEVELEVREQIAQAVRELEAIELAAREEIIRKQQEVIDQGAAGFERLVGASDQFLGRELNRITEIGRATASSLADQEQRHLVLEQAIQDAESATERRAAEADLERVKRAEERSERILENKREEVTKLFNAEKGFGAASALISGTAAAIAALRAPPVGLGPGPAGIILASTTEATAIAAAAFIATQKAPQFHTGFAGFSSVGQEVSVNLTAGEFIGNERAREALGGPDGARHLNETGRVPAAAGGGGGTTILRVGGRDFGRAVVDEARRGRELSRALRNMTGRIPGFRPVYAGS